MKSNTNSTRARSSSSCAGNEVKDCNEDCGNTRSKAASQCFESGIDDDNNHLSNYKFVHKGDFVKVPVTWTPSRLN